MRRVCFNIARAAGFLALPASSCQWHGGCPVSGGAVSVGRFFLFVAQAPDQLIVQIGSRAFRARPRRSHLAARIFRPTASDRRSGEAVERPAGRGVSIRGRPASSGEIRGYREKCVGSTVGKESRDERCAIWRCCPARRDRGW